MRFSAYLSAAPKVFFHLPGTLIPFPPPLRGPRRAKLALEVRVGGAPREVGVRGTPTPDSSERASLVSTPQGGGERTFRAARIIIRRLEKMQAR